MTITEEQSKVSSSSTNATQTQTSPEPVKPSKVIPEGAWRGKDGDYYIKGPSGSAVRID